MEIATCPTSDQIIQLLRGELADPLATQLTLHLESCSLCLLSLQQMEESGSGSQPAEEKTAISVLPVRLPAAAEAVLASSLKGNQLAFLGPPVSDDEIGWLAHFRILAVLGEGGMGTVLLAEDTQLERTVALKVIKSEFSADNDVQQRFMREARAMAQVKSDHVVTIHQVGQHDGTCYIAMELLEGMSLHSLLDTERPTFAQTLRIGREIAAALSAAHARGLIHRDIKPENVWLEAPSGRVKLLDFGLARPQSVNVKLTSSGIIVGTPAFMSPEQARAQDVDERSDLFSLGCLLYKLISGRIPFHGETLMATLFALASETPNPPSFYNRDCPLELDYLIMALLAKLPDERPASAQVVIAQLEAIESQLAPQSSDQSNLSTPGTLLSPSSWLRAPVKSASQIQSQIQKSQIQGPSQMTASRRREAERRQVTVLSCSCDLFESQDYLEQLDVEEQAKILRAFDLACRQTVHLLKGAVVQGNSESLLACFGYPVAQEDAAQLACGAALAIQEALAELTEQLHRDHDLELNPRIGIHTGPAIVELKGEDVSLVGEARNVAGRLKDVIATDARIVCSESTHRVLRGRFDCLSLGTHKIKGLEQPIELFQVQAESAAGSAIEAAGPVELTPLTGREQEMSLLKDRRELAEEGMGQVVLLIGEAGLGKSRLVHTMKEHVLSKSAPAKASLKRIQDRPVIEWYCSPHFCNSGLYPASNFFQRLLNFTRDEAPDVQFDRLVHYLDSYGLAAPDLVPLFASLLSLPADSRFPSLILSPAREREEMFRALQLWLQAYSQAQPVLFIIEDLHWLDASTLEFLEQFLAEGAGDRVLTLLTFRPEFRPPWQAFSQQTSLSLNRLTKRQVSDLMRKKLGAHVPQAVIDKVYDRSSGVPLFVEEFTTVVQESKLADTVSDSGARLKTLMERTIPATLQDLIMARLDRIDGDRELAQLAATLGREFSYELIAAVAEVDEQMLDGELTKLVQAEILYQKGRRPQSTYLFKHALLEDALYNTLMKDKRQQFHGRIAQALEARFPHIMQRQPELIAHHFLAAGLTEQSLPYWLAAGLRSQEQFANVEAISHLEKGLQALSTLPESSDRDRHELALLNPLGSSYQLARGYAAPQVGPAFARARQLCQRIGDRSQLFEIMWGNWTWHLVRGDLKLCMDLADEMVALAAQGPDSGIKMEASVAPAVTAFYRGDFVGCRSLCEKAIGDYEEMDSCIMWSLKLGQNSAVVLRCYLSLALWHLGFPDQAIKLNDETLTLARQIAHPFSLAHALHFTGWLYQYCRLPDKLQTAAAEEMAIASEQGFALWQSTAVFFNGAAKYQQGDLMEGLDQLEKGLQSFETIAAALTKPAQLAVLAEAWTQAQLLQSAQQALNEGLAEADKHQDHSHLAELHRLKGALALVASNDQAAAETSFQEAIETARQQGSKAWELRATTSLARLWQEQGDGDKARDLLAAIYGGYEEGLGTPDLQEAQELLSALRS